MEFGIVPVASIIGMVISMIVAIAAPIGLLIYMMKKYKASIVPFFIGAGVFIVFALVLEQLMHLGVFAAAGGQEKLSENVWIYGLYGATAAAVFEETGRYIAMKFLFKKRRDRINTLMYGIGHGGIESILIVGLSSVSNIATSIAINTGTIQSSMALVDDSMKQTLFDQLSQLWTIPSYQFYIAGVERILAITIQIILSFFIYWGVKYGKKRYIALAYLYHFAVDFSTVIIADIISTIAAEVIVALFAAGGIFMVYKKEKAITTDNNDK